MSDVLTTGYLDGKLKQSFDDFALRIVKMLEPRFGAIDAKLDELDAKFDHLTDTLDAFIGRLDDIEADNQARDAQVDRLREAIKQIAQQTGVKLTVDI